MKQKWILGILLSLFCATQAGEPVITLGPPIPPPKGVKHSVRDVCGNFWALAPMQEGKRQLIVLPAQARVKWIPAEVAGLSPDAWQAVTVREDGFVWLEKAGKKLRFDPRKPELGAKEAEMTEERIPIDPAWRVVSYMPTSNHDLTAAAVGGRFYVAGGLSADWGFPARSHPFDELWEMNPKARWLWRTAAKLSRERIYCATAAFENKVWIIGGDVIESDGTRHAVTTIEIYDPKTGRVAAGPPSTIARPMPMALAARGRLYVMGNVKGEYDKPGKMESIGPGETTWRPEPDGPEGMGPLAGTVLDEILYVLVPGKGLCSFDPQARQWAILNSPTQPRSCQMAAYRGEIWMVGGRDVVDLRQTLIYNPRTRAYRNGPRLPIPLSWGAAEVVDGKLVIAGGAAERSPADKTWIYNDRTFVLNDR